MKKALSIIILINILFTACDCSYQYGVYARNATDQDIHVVCNTNLGIEYNLSRE